MGRRRGTSLQQCERVEHECNRLGIRPPIVDEVYDIPLAPKPRVLSHFTIPEAASIAQSIGLVACLCLLVHRELRRECAVCWEAYRYKDGIPVANSRLVKTAIEHHSTSGPIWHPRDTWKRGVHRSTRHTANAPNRAELLRTFVLAVKDRDVVATLEVTSKLDHDRFQMFAPRCSRYASATASCDPRRCARFYCVHEERTLATAKGQTGKTRRSPLHRSA